MELNRIFTPQKFIGFYEPHQWLVGLLIDLCEFVEPGTASVLTVWIIRYRLFTHMVFEYCDKGGNQVLTIFGYSSVCLGIGQSVP